MNTKTLSLPKLNLLTPTLESTTLKLMEETGELAQVIGKYRGMSGEKVSLTEEQVLNEIGIELLDVAQTAVTMMFVLEEYYGIDIEDLLKKHCSKLQEKGYLSSE